MLISLSRLMGMPAVWKDEHMGHVERAVMDAPAGRMDGLIVRRGLSGAKWVPREQIALIGQSCVMLHSRPVRMTDRPLSQPMQVYFTSGECAGEVTDGVVDGDTLALCALEVSRGPLARWLGHARYARQFRPVGDGLMVSSLLSWAQLLGEIGEEDDG